MRWASRKRLTKGFSTGSEGAVLSPAPAMQREKAQRQQKRPGRPQDHRGGYGMRRPRRRRPRRGQQQTAPAHGRPKILRRRIHADRRRDVQRHHQAEKRRRPEEQERPLRQPIDAQRSARAGWPRSARPRACSFQGVPSSHSTPLSALSCAQFPTVRASSGPAARRSSRSAEPS